LFVTLYQNYIPDIPGGDGGIGGVGGVGGDGGVGGTIGVEGPSGFIGTPGPFFFPAIKHQTIPITTTTAIIIPRVIKFG